MIALSLPLILASGSPRRKELLLTLGVPFQVAVSDVNEDFENDWPVEEIPARLSVRKAQAVLKMHPKALVLAADTIVAFENHILNKPVDLIEARYMLNALSGKIHQVYSSFTLCSAQKTITQTDRADVHFKKLSTAEIAYYLENGHPLDKAGAYGIQEWIGLVAVEKIVGSYFTVMGLPTHLVWPALNNWER